MSTLTTLKGRCIYVWQLKPVLVSEMGIDNFVNKAVKAKFSSIWIKVAEGEKRYKNIDGDMKAKFEEVVSELKKEGIDVWGWHVPYAATVEAAKKEAQLAASIADEFNLAGILMDAESESVFFKGNAETADVYAGELKNLLAIQSKGLAISSHDVPKNFPDFPFDAFARHATVNAPQVYYGGSPSVSARLNKAIHANSHLGIPFVPVGAGWIGSDDGGCSSASACAERATAFMKLVKDHDFPAYSFWHWQGAPSNLWAVFFSEPVHYESEDIPKTVSVAPSNDSGFIADLVSIGSDPVKIKIAQQKAKEAWKYFPKNGCAANLSSLLQMSGINVPMILGAGNLAKELKKRGWTTVKFGDQKPGDVGVTFDFTEPPGADHVYLVLKVNPDKDQMLISDNQDDVPHTRYASGYGKTKTEYFLRAV